jgi:hypothetical protein
MHAQDPATYAAAFSEAYLLKTDHHFKDAAEA